MIKPLYCCDCGAVLKQRRSVRCRRCASSLRWVEKGVDWRPEEVATLTAYAGMCEKISQLQQQLNDARFDARALRLSLRGRHSSDQISRKITYLKERGQIPRTSCGWVHSEVVQR